MGEQKTKHTSYDLAQMQSLPLEQKVIMSQRRIQEWYDYWDGQVYVSFSGGKDSTVLLDIVRKMYPDVPAVFVNTGLEYPEIQAFVKEHENVTILRPKMRFDEVLKTYGYPVLSKEIAKKLEAVHLGQNWSKPYVEGTAKTPTGEYSHYNVDKYAPVLQMDWRISPRCCNVMKKEPVKEYGRRTGRKPITGTMAVESATRKGQWKRKGCNAFDTPQPISNPMSFWTNQDVLQYLQEYHVPYCSVYGEIVEDKKGKLKTTGLNRTGCVFCGFGCHLDKSPTRFQRLQETHPKQYQYCIGGGEYDEDGVWGPNKDGLGMGHVFDELNTLYGEHFIDYK